MKIQYIQIEGVGGIANLHIPLNAQMSILCGPNGIGKTTVLECIAHCFTHGPTQVLKRNVGAASSKITASLTQSSDTMPVEIKFDQYEPNDHALISSRHDKSAFLLSLKTTRTFVYTPLNSIGKDSDKPAHLLWEESKTGVSVQDVKNWFVNRYLYSAHPGALSPAQLDNFRLAKLCFSALNKKFSFAKVNASSNEILVDTPSGQIYYEYLSSGFKSCIAVLFGIIKEIEFRFSNMKAEEFEGVVLIDEIELHLHPEWQYQIAGVLVRVFPRAQFVVTTHSPHVIQSAEPDQIIALESLGGEVRLRHLPKTGYGFKGWTVDEVLTDVMGMMDTRTDVFIKLMAEFDAALENENQEAATVAYKKLDESLHPLSHVRKLLRLQLASIASDQS